MSGYFNTATYFASPYFGSGGVVTTTGGGGGHWWRNRKGFGSYVDEIMREQLKSERKVDPPKPKWIRHYDD